MEKLKLNFVVNYWSLMYIDFELHTEAPKTNQSHIACEKCIFFASYDYLFMMASLRASYARSDKKRS